MSWHSLHEMQPASIQTFLMGTRSRACGPHRGCRSKAAQGRGSRAPSVFAPRTQSPHTYERLCSCQLRFEEEDASAP
jgi:hypothetical protein